MAGRFVGYSMKDDPMAKDPYLLQLLEGSVPIPEFTSYRIFESGVIFSFRTMKFLTWVLNDETNYYIVTLRSDNGELKRKYVHRLVATVFIPNPNNYPQVNHIDFNRKNPDVKNLEWCTQSMNERHSWNAGRKKAGMGMLGHKGILHVDSVPVEMYSLDGVFIKDFYSMAEASEYSGVGKTAISYCCSGKTKYPRFYIFKLKQNK